jgi:S-layer homology domain
MASQASRQGDSPWGSLLSVQTELRKLAYALAGLCMLLAAVAGATDFYVSPTAGAGGNGSLNNPWKLQTALDHPSVVQPGDTIWLRGGTYNSPPYTSTLVGTSAAPIIVRQYPGERAIIDGNYDGDLPTLTILGKYAWFWGFEIFNSDPTRFTQDGDNPPRRGPGVHLSRDGTRLINMIVHDTSQGVITGEDATDARIYGSLFYYNGYDSPDRGHGHGIYAQNLGSTPKPIHDNIIFQQYGWGIHAYGEGGHLDNLDFQGNVSFNNGGLSGGYHANILVGGLQVTTNPKLIANYTYNTDHENKNDLGYAAGCTSPQVKDNYFASHEAIDINNCSSLTITGNTFYGTTSGFSPSAFPNNTYYGQTRPTGVQVFVRPNAYELGRAHIVVYNWDLDPAVTVDLSSVLSPGASYVVRNAQNPFGAAVATGTYGGGPISLPMTGLTPAAPVGASLPPATGPEFQVFLLTSTLGPYEFFDVPASNIFHDVIHTLAANGVTAGCGNGNFCPNDSVDRAQMAVFLLKSKHGAAYVPPAASGDVFDDVPSNAFAAAWIERLAAEGIASGCGGGNYCPNSAVTRAQMAVFLLKALLGSTYAPPPATGNRFDDVPANAFAAAWIEDLADRGITSGCGGGNYCPGIPNTRAQMAAFLVTTFSLQ